MSKAQLVITAVILEGRSKSAVARDCEVSRIGCSSCVSGDHTAVSSLH
jgi:hypothetical protein